MKRYLLLIRVSSVENGKRTYHAGSALSITEESDSNAISRIEPEKKFWESHNFMTSGELKDEDRVVAYW